jgi:hypothetical protein
MLDFVFVVLVVIEPDAVVITNGSSAVCTDISPDADDNVRAEPPGLVLTVKLVASLTTCT